MSVLTVAQVILRLIAVFLGVITFLPFLRTNLWWVRLCDFPRLQVAVLALLLLILAIVSGEHLERIDQVLTGLLAVVLVIQGWFIAPFTPLARKSVPDAPWLEPERTLRLVTANVLMENRGAAALLAILRKHDPDIILLAEPDAQWMKQCLPLVASHPFTLLQPQSNTYGMALYSRFELIAPEVLFRVEHDVPSMRAGVRLPGGRVVELHAVHPRPPGIDSPGSDRQSALPRDAELILVAREIEERGLPALVIGDFNDVAWSHTTRLFQRLGHLLDPRVGRGLFNTYHAQYPPMRYPVDHVFHTRHFSLAALERLSGFGSDHFPIFAALVFQSQNSVSPSRQPNPQDGDRQEAEETTSKATPE